MNCVILHGNKLSPSGELSSDMQKRIDVLLQTLASTKHELLIITGGVSSKVKKPESEAIYEKIQDLINIPVALEKTSKTTVQNILNTLNLIQNETVDTLTVITSKQSLRRFKRLYKMYMPNYYNQIDFVIAENSAAFKTFLREVILYVTSLFDPHEFWVRPFIRKFRS